MGQDIGSGRLEGKIAVVVGAGQSPGSGPDDDTIGNGRATALLFAREGAKVLAVDRVLASAQQTVDLITAENGEAVAMQADICDESQAAAITATCLDTFGAIDILHNNVGIGAGDGGVTTLELDTWNRIYDTNVTGMFLTCKHAIPAMRAGGGGVIVNISSVAAIASTSIDARARGADPDEVRAGRDRMVPFGGHQGTGWDTAYAALFLASDESRFITGVLLPVDGGAAIRVG